MADKPAHVVKLQPVPTVPPVEFVKPCPPPLSRPIVKTGDAYDRMTVAERALAVCALQVESTRAWRDRVLRDSAPDATN